MPKYRVNVGSLVTKYMERTYTISANSEEEAYQKAEERFRKACEDSPTFCDCGDTVNLSDIERIS